MKYLIILLLIISSCSKTTYDLPKPEKCGIIKDWYSGIGAYNEPYYYFVMKWDDGTYSNIKVPLSIFLKKNNGDKYCSKYY